MYVNEMEFDCQMSSFELEYINHMNTIIDFSVCQNENIYALLHPFRLHLIFILRKIKNSKHK